MKTSYIYLGVIAILMWNGLLIKRDHELFKAHSACTQITSHSNCPYQKK